MIRKLKTNWIAIALTVVVIISLILSWAIWTNPFPYDGARDSLSNKQSQYSPQSMGDVYLPTKVIQTSRSGKQNQLYSQQDNLVLNVKDQLRHWKLNHTTTIKRDNSDVYLSYLRRRNSLMLTYPDEIPGTVFNETFSQSVDTGKVSQLNHIVIPLNGQHEIYLLSDHRYSIYRLHVDKGNFSKVRKLLTKMKKIAVEHKIINGSAVMMYSRSFELPVLGYQVTSQNIDNLSSNLMNSNRHTTITANRSGDETVYTDGTNKRIIYDRQLGTLKYENYLSKDDRESTSQIYQHFYNKLTATGIPLDSLRYDSSSNHGRKLNYRTYVDSFPIFNNNGYGEITLESKSNGNERYWLSLYSLQVPLPLKHQMVKLPASGEIISQLHNSNHLKDVKDVRVGYAWHNDDQNSRVVKLVPTYFVKYKGNWVEYTELQK